MPENVANEMKRYNKFVGILLVLVLFSSLNLCYSNDVALPENLKKQMLRLKEEIKKAAASGDIEAYKKVKDEYMQIINKDPELKKALVDYKQTASELLEHREKAEKYFLDGKYNLALKEYKEFLLLANKEDYQKVFSRARAFVFLGMGKIYMKIDNEIMANKSFENALSEKMLPLDKKFIKMEIGLLKVERKKK